MDLKAYLVGGGIGTLAAAAFMLRDAQVPGDNITIFEATAVSGGSLDADGNPTDGYCLRSGRLLTTNTYECNWDLDKSIPSLGSHGKSVFDETVEFNQKHRSHSVARLVDRRRANMPVSSMDFPMRDRIELLALTNADDIAT